MGNQTKLNQTPKDIIKKKTYNEKRLKKIATKKMRTRLDKKI